MLKPTRKLQLLRTGSTLLTERKTAKGVGPAKKLRFGSDAKKIQTQAKRIPSGLSFFSKRQKRKMKQQAQELILLPAKSKSDTVTTAREEKLTRPAIDLVLQLLSSAKEIAGEGEQTVAADAIINQFQKLMAYLERTEKRTTLASTIEAMTNIKQIVDARRGNFSDQLTKVEDQQGTRLSYLTGKIDAYHDMSTTLGMLIDIAKKQTP